VLAAEDLLVFEILFDRDKDWRDIEELIYPMTDELDAGYVPARAAPPADVGHPRCGGDGMRKLFAWGATLALAGAAALGGLAAWRLLESDVEARVYRARLEALVSDYESLRDRYNEAVRRTAVTELRVADGKLSAVVRDASGVERVIETPYDPSREIYVDFAILNGRLWIRRLFDGRTPPEQGLLIDPGLAEVDWNADPEAYGKAAYRSLGEGRWVVSVTGDGSLGLAAWQDDGLPELSPPPPVRAYEPLEESVDARLQTIRPEEALRALAARLGVIQGES
jgi:hypothetical protein